MSCPDCGGGSDRPCECVDVTAVYNALLFSEARGAIEQLRQQLAAEREQNEKLRAACASGWGEPVLVNTLRAELAEMTELAEKATRQVEDTNKEYAAAVIALAAERAKRCGQCADWKASCCLNVNSRCYGLLAIPSDHGCPWFRQREEGR